MNARATSITYVLDTSVILHDAQCVKSFAEHNVVIPVTVLEELDGFKKGADEKGLQAREVARILDEISETASIYTNGGAVINPKMLDSGRLRIVNDRDIKVRNRRGVREDASQTFGRSSADNRILTTALRLKEQGASGEIILVTNDRLLRVKARGAYGLRAEAYRRSAVENIQTISLDGRELEVEDQLIADLNKLSQPWASFMTEEPSPNQYFILKGKEDSCLAYCNPVDGRIWILKMSKTGFGIKPRNAEQTFALHAVLNPDATLVALNGKAGTGKTLIAVAGALEQRTSFRKILVARPIVGLSNKDLGFLPGEIKDKIGPHMEAIWDNFSVVANQTDLNEAQQKKLQEVREKEKFSVLPLAYIRGRSLSKTLLIIDESQNLTPIEVKTIVTRAGEGTKIVFTGDIHQIDTPYLNEHNNGLSYLIERMRRNKVKFFAHVNLRKGERSYMAEIAANVL